VNRTTSSISSETQCLINQPFIKTPINTEDELEAVEAKLINYDQNHEFRSQLVSVIFYFNGGNLVFINKFFSLLHIVIHFKIFKKKYSFISI